MFKCSHVQVFTYSFPVYPSITSFGINWIYNQGLLPTTMGCDNFRLYLCLDTTAHYEYSE